MGRCVRGGLCLRSYHRRVYGYLCSDTGQARRALQCLWYAHISERMLTAHCEGDGVYGKPIAADRAERLGIINHTVPADELETFTYSLAREIVENAPLSISVMKEQLRMLAGAHPMSPRRFERVQGLRRIVYDSEDYMEGIRAFREKRKPKFLGR